MSYSDPITISHPFGVHDFGAGADESLSIKGPSGMKGRLIDISVSATEVFTTGGKVQVGTGADPDAYAELAIGTLADTDCLTASETAGAIIEPDIPQDTQVEVTLVKTGGTPTGQGMVNIVISWF